MKKEKLHVFILEWFEPSRRWVCRLSGAYIPLATTTDKAIAIRMMAAELQAAAEEFGQHSELRIRNKNGRFAPARTYPRSADPKRSRG